jgi:type II secretory pathway component PulC
MMFFRSLVIGLLSALLILQIQHLFQHARHEHAHQHAHLHQHARAHHSGAGQDAQTTWRRPRPGTVTAAATLPPPRSGRVTPITADTVLVDIERSSMLRLAAGQGLPNQARLVPSLRKGRMEGLTFYAIRPGSLFAALGVQNGDTMLSINGTSMGQPGCASLDLFADPPEVLDIDLVREGKPVRMVVVVHEPRVADERG